MNKLTTRQLHSISASELLLLQRQLETELRYDSELVKTLQKDFDSLKTQIRLTCEILIERACYMQDVQSTLNHRRNKAQRNIANNEHGAL